MNIYQVAEKTTDFSTLFALAFRHVKLHKVASSGTGGGCPLEIVDEMARILRAGGVCEGTLTLYTESWVEEDGHEVSPVIECRSKCNYANADLPFNTVFKPTEGWEEKGVYLDVLMYGPSTQKLNYLDVDLSKVTQHEKWEEQDKAAYADV